jgi:hypothetical protein
MIGARMLRGYWKCSPPDVLLRLLLQYHVRSGFLHLRVIRVVDRTEAEAKATRFLVYRVPAEAAAVYGAPQGW